MTSQALYRKWRSQTFDELIGQQHVTKTLVNALKLDRIAHAYLFSGPRGTGKTSTARLLAKAVNCLEPNLEKRPCNECRICRAVNEGRLLDLIEIDAASNTGVDDIRDLRDKVGFRPGEARIKFYIIDEVHMLSNSAFNALLKTLEEPPAHVIFVLATTEPEKIPATITSRCQRFDFKRITVENIADRLAYILSEEGLQAEPEALEYIARQGGGSMRDAISLLDQLTAYGTETITLKLVQRVLGAVTSQAVVELAEALLSRDVAAGLDIINQMVDEGIDSRQLAREIVEYLRAVMVIKLGGSVELVKMPLEVMDTIKAQAAKADIALVVKGTELFNEAMVDIKSGLLAMPQLPLELAFVEATMEFQQSSTTASPQSVTAAPISQPVKTPPAPASKKPTSVPASSLPVSTQSPSLSPSQKISRPASVKSSTPAPPQNQKKKRDESTEASSITVDTVRECFEQVVQDIEQKNKVMAVTLYNQTRLSRVSGNSIYFVTLKNMKERFEKPQPKQALNEAFSRAIGQPVSVHFLTEEVIAQPEEEHLTELPAELLELAQDLGGELIE